MDISGFLSKPFEMKVSPDLTITSPVPSVATGKILTAYREISAEQARRINAGETILTEEERAIPGWPDTTEGLARLALGDDEWERLVGLGAPEEFIVQASMCAVVFWGSGGWNVIPEGEYEGEHAGEAAVQLYLEAISGKTTAPAAPKGNRAQRLSKNGQRSA